MAFVLRGEIDIEGRKGIATLRQVQGEAVKTTKAFEQGSKVNAHFAKMLLGINSQAAATHKALFLLARTSGAGLFGVAAVKAGIDLGETLMQVGQEAESAGKSLDRTFRAGLKATTAEGVQSSIESITDQIEKLRAKSEGFSLRRLLGKGIEKLTGIDIGLTPEEGLIKAGELETAVLEKRLAQRKELEKIVKLQEESAQNVQLQNSKEEETIKLRIAEGGKAAKSYRAISTEQFRIAETNLNKQRDSLESLRDQKKQLELINGINKDEPAIRKIALDIRKQEIEVIKAQTQYIQAQRKEEYSVLSGSKTGRAALGRAEKRKAQQEEKEAKRRADDAVTNRQRQENEKRRKEGKPPLNRQDIENLMADEAVGNVEVKTQPAPSSLPSAATGGGAGGVKAEITAPPMADTMKNLLEEFKNLAGILKTAPIVSSASGTA